MGPPIRWGYSIVLRRWAPLHGIGIIEVVASITISGLDESLEARLRVRAEVHGHSMEEEVRDILRMTICPETVHEADGSRPRESLATAIRRIVEPIGGMELDLPGRGIVPEPPSFE
jgi:plasmid stability protein